MNDSKDRYSHGGNIYEIASRHGTGIMDFSASINPMGIPPRVRRLLRGKNNLLNHYPDPDSRRLKTALARYWEVKEDNVLVGNGSTELIYLVMGALRSSSVSIPAPSFTEYERAAGIVKRRVKFIRLLENEGFRLKTKNLKPCDTLFLCNPNNPTGNLIVSGPADIEELPAKRIVVDESFMDFLHDERVHTLIGRAWRSKKIIVIRTFTKFFAFPGLRVGYAIAHRDIIGVLRRFQMPWSVNVLAQQAAEWALSEEGYMRRSRKFIEKERLFLHNAISRLEGFNPYSSVANFLLVKIKDKRLTSSCLKKLLLKKKILIRDCANFRGLDERFVRIAVRSRKDNMLFVKAMEEICV